MTPENFWERVRKTETCWLWTGSISDDGYGYLNTRIDGRVTKVFAHRFSYELHNRPIPKGLQVRHFVCDTPGCVRPDHLRIGTHSDNQRDIPFKRRSEIKRKMWANLSEETLKIRSAKIAASKLGKKLSPEHVEKLRLAKLGKPAKLSDEAKAKKNEALKARWASFTPEQLAERTQKFSDAQKGRPLTESHRQALVEAWKRRRAKIDH